MLVLDMLAIGQDPRAAARKASLAIRCGMLLMGLGLLVATDSKTSIVCLVLGLAALWALRWVPRWRKPGQVLAAGLGTGLLLLSLNSAFNLSGATLLAMGRDETLTGRTEIWQACLDQPFNPLLGCGFQCFWYSPFGQAANEEAGFRLDQAIAEAHNGYLETYLDGGVVGLLFLAALLLTSAYRLLREVIAGDQVAKVKFMFFLTALAFNMTEASFFRRESVWFAFVLAVMQVRPAPEQRPASALAMAHRTGGGMVPQGAS
jgi:O-antigen ligase